MNRILDRNVRGGGVVLYVANNLQYKISTDLSIGGNTNSIFVEIDRMHLKSKLNTIVGCIYSNEINCDVSMSMIKCNLKLFLLHNELVLNYPK